MEILRLTTFRCQTAWIQGSSRRGLVATQRVVTLSQRHHFRHQGASWLDLAAETAPTGTSAGVAEILGLKGGVAFTAQNCACRATCTGRIPSNLASDDGSLESPLSKLEFCPGDYRSLSYLLLYEPQLTCRRPDVLETKVESIRRLGRGPGRAGRNAISNCDAKGLSNLKRTC